MLLFKKFKEINGTEIKKNSIYEKADRLKDLSKYIKLDFQLGRKCLFLYKNKITNEYIYLVQELINSDTHEKDIYYAIHRGKYFEKVDDMSILDIDLIKATILKKLNDRMLNLDRRKEEVLNASVSLMAM
ncbi:hypothetical protein [Clostridium thermobutyricum]|uniref:hypothetical protein n=1 Tax=Clostridium thermobutyricum TaxID=29372 RepID=UPI0018ABDEB1|nr:hypothetical protein [Clostridium thermobutyricum]